MAPSPDAVPSPFAAALARLLDDTGLFDRAGWALFFGVPEEAVADWVADRALPRADLVRMALDCLRTRDGVPAEPLAAFDRGARAPSSEASPLLARLAASLEEYMADATLGGTGRDLSFLAYDDQVALLRRGSWTPAAVAARDAPPALPN
jgi:hypothetical protein